jgi:hypothetical protein
MAQTHALAGALLKRKYGPGIHDQLNNETIAFGIFKKIGRERWGGSNFFHSLRTARNRTTRPGGEQTALPASGRQVFANAQVGCRLYHGTGGFTAFGAAASEGNDTAFGEMIKVEVDGLIADARKDFNVDTYGTPLGVLGRITNNPGGAATLLQLEQAQDLNAWRSYGNRYISPGQVIDILNEGDGTLLQTVTVNTVSAGNRTDINSPAATPIIAGVDAGDLIVRSGTQDTGAPVYRALNGLEHLIDDSSTMPLAANALGVDLDTLEGISRAPGAPANSYWHGNVLDLGGVALTEASLQNLVYRTEERSGTYPDLFLTHRSVQYAIQQLMVGDRRFVPQTFPGGFKAESLVYNAGDRDIPIVVDRECPYDRLYSINLDAMHNYVLRDVELIEEDGSVLRQSAGGGDEWDFTFRAFFNLGTTQPNALGKMVRIGGADEAFGIGAARVYDF